MKAYLVMGLIILVLLGLVIIFIKCLISSSKKNKELKKQLQARNENIKQLLIHSEQLVTINQNKTDVYKQLAEAKSDEEINKIIANLISSNNNKLQKHTTE
jgi:predicted Holliday junction resolvase-like endonuclease